MSQPRLATGHERFPYRKGEDGKPLCRVCGTKLSGRRTSFCGQACVDTYWIATSQPEARRQVWKRDRGVCALCGLDTERLKERIAVIGRAWHVAKYGVADDQWLTRRKPKRKPWYELAAAFVEQARMTLDLHRPGLSRRVVCWSTSTHLSVGHLWEADHVVPVAEGGGHCGLENYRTLCLPCHHGETGALRRRLNARKRVERNTSDIVELFAAHRQEGLFS